MNLKSVFIITLGAALAGCAGDAGDEDPLAGLTLVSEDPSDNPLPGLDDDWKARFARGDVNFEAIFLPSQGLGPVYIRHSCASCHADDARGPGAVRKMVVADPEALRLDDDQSSLRFGHTVRPQVAYESEDAGAELEGVVPPDTSDILITTRFGPAAFGRGYIEAIDDAAIEAVEAEQAARDDGIAGHINRVPYQSEQNPDDRFHDYAPGQQGLIGRFGLKARIPTIDDFVADAYQGDMGITSPLRPEELPNPIAQDDGSPGVDIDADTVNFVADYVRLLRIPARRPDAQDERGAELFEEVKCSVCHVPSMRTREDYPIEDIADIDAPIYSDMLLHDMGPAFWDGLSEFDAGPSDWKTAPLMGLRLLRNYLHDGRARTIEDAIVMHGEEGSEAEDSVELYLALPDDDRETLLRFVSAL